ncbi:MAG: hypothetical protein H7138_20730 [Myxococcales bacterium]|nr:hypothetical protein [Myxococcales bacterium]
MTAQRRVARWVLGSAAVVTAASLGAALWAYDARRDADALDDKRRRLTATPADLAAYNRLVADTQQREHLALGLGLSGAAIALLGAGMWWFDRVPPGSDPRIDVKPVVGPDRAGLTVRGAF